VLNCLALGFGLMAKALIDGRIDCKTAGWLVVHPQVQKS
jgi:hypothetical protein